MRLAAYILSICLHTAVFLALWFWPGSGPVKLDAPPITISLVEGAPGGNRTPSPILGHMGETGEGELAPTPPAPQSETAALAREEIKTPEPTKVPPRAVEPEPAEIKPEPIEIPKPPQEQPKPETPPKPEPVKEAKLEPKPVPKPEPKPEPKKPEPKKPEPKKEPPKKAPPKKPTPKKPAQDPIAAALQQARKATSRASSGDKGNAIEQALAQAQKNARGNRGGGGGEGGGPGGGGLGDVYIGQVMVAVRPNWGFAAGGRKSLVCVVKVNVDLQGVVQQAVVSQSSGNPQYDASAVNAILRTSAAGDFPPPPNSGYTELDVVFTMDELMGRR
ncbi:MAG: TonB C-terminal domain-containing protein [Desulfovibrio sp.]|nr:TonB C-terminal domain-containing protein [Desulfovibrio sp.]